MMEPIHYGQWLGTVRLPRTPEDKQGVLYGMALLSIDRDRPQDFSLRFRRNRVFNSEDAPIIPSFEIIGEITTPLKTEVGQDLLLIPKKIEVREYKELLREESLGEKMEFESFDDFRGFIVETFKITFPASSTLGFDRIHKTDGSFNPNVVSGDFLGIMRGKEVCFNIALLRSFYRSDRTLNDHLQTSWRGLLEWNRSWTPLVGDSSETRFLFRGQSDIQHKLTTTLARRGRYILWRYWNETCPEALSQCLISDREPNPYLSLTKRVRWLRHRGHPSPLMDWTRGCEVALYFAYSPPEPARDRVVYALDHKLWENDWLDFAAQTEADILDPRAFVVRTPYLEDGQGCENESAQKGVYLHCAVEDVEQFFRQLEGAYENHSRIRHNYLYRFVLPFGDRTEVLRELDSRGINESTLFPGAEGLVRHITRSQFGDV